MIARRPLLTAAAANLAAPFVARAQTRDTLKIVPEGDLPILDPVFTTATIVRNHGYMVYDTLYGMDVDYRMQPQMLAGHSIEDDGRRWILTLRPGLLFHDGTPVLARDCVASIRRYCAKDSFGQALMAVTDELSALDDRRIQFRLKKPFPLLPNALGKPSTPMPCIMPERLALTDPNKQVTEMVGSGPYRFATAERVPGSRVVYERFAGYVPREDGPAAFTAGPKIAHFPRVEWHVIPDAATAVNALVNGEVDWVQQPAADLLPVIRANARLTTILLEPGGSLALMRFNHLYPPFDNPAIRRALLWGIDQAEFETASLGEDRSLWKDNVGFFSPGTPMANSAGMEVLTAPRDLDRVRRELKAAGYDNRPVVMLGATDYPALQGLALVGADLLRKVGMNVDFQSVDWGTTVQRRNSRKPPAEGGWNIFYSSITGVNNFDPAGHLGLRGNGAAAWPGWPTSPEIEALRAAWLEAPTQEDRKRICERIQLRAWIDVPYIPLGSQYQPNAYTKSISTPRIGFVQGYDVKRI
jgi:peptide/nickel transport system substrate-binding protein